MVKGIWSLFLSIKYLSIKSGKVSFKVLNVLPQSCGKDDATVKTQKLVLLPTFLCKNNKLLTLTHVHIHSLCHFHSILAKNLCAFKCFYLKLCQSGVRQCKQVSEHVGMCVYVREWIHLLYVCVFVLATKTFTPFRI